MSMGLKKITDIKFLLLHSPNPAAYPPAFAVAPPPPPSSNNRPPSSSANTNNAAAGSAAGSGGAATTATPGAALGGGGSGAAAGVATGKAGAGGSGGGGASVNPTAPATEEAMRQFFVDVYDAWVKTLMNPFYLVNMPVVSPVFRARVAAAGKKYL